MSVEKTANGVTELFEDRVNKIANVFNEVYEEELNKTFERIYNENKNEKYFADDFLRFEFTDKSAMNTLKLDLESKGEEVIVLPKKDANDKYVFEIKKTDTAQTNLNNFEALYGYEIESYEKRSSDNRRFYNDIFQKEDSDMGFFEKAAERNKRATENYGTVSDSMGIASAFLSQVGMGAVLNKGDTVESIVNKNFAAHTTQTIVYYDEESKERKVLVNGEFSTDENITQKVLKEYEEGKQIADNCLLQYLDEYEATGTIYGLENRLTNKVRYELDSVLEQINILKSAGVNITFDDAGNVVTPVSSVTFNEKNGYDFVSYTSKKTDVSETNESSNNDNKVLETDETYVDEDSNFSNEDADFTKEGNNIIDKNGNIYNKEVKKLTTPDGKVISGEIVTDKKGNVLLDKDGNIVVINIKTEDLRKRLNIKNPKIKSRAVEKGKDEACNLWRFKTYEQMTEEFNNVEALMETSSGKKLVETNRNLKKTSEELVSLRKSFGAAVAGIEGKVSVMDMVNVQKEFLKRASKNGVDLFTDGKIDIRKISKLSAYQLEKLGIDNNTRNILIRMNDTDATKQFSLGGLAFMGAVKIMTADDEELAKTVNTANKVKRGSRLVKDNVVNVKRLREVKNSKIKKLKNTKIENVNADATKIKAKKVNTNTGNTNKLEKNTKKAIKKLDKKTVANEKFRQTRIGKIYNKGNGAVTAFGQSRIAKLLMSAKNAVMKVAVKFFAHYIAIGGGILLVLLGGIIVPFLVIYLLINAFLSIGTAADRFITEQLAPDSYDETVAWKLYEYIDDEEKAWMEDISDFGEIYARRITKSYGIKGLGIFDYINDAFSSDNGYTQLVVEGTSDTYINPFYSYVDNSNYYTTVNGFDGKQEVLISPNASIYDTVAFNESAIANEELVSAYSYDFISAEDGHTSNLKDILAIIDVQFGMGIDSASDQYLGSVFGMSPAGLEWEALKQKVLGILKWFVDELSSFFDGDFVALDIKDYTGNIVDFKTLQNYAIRLTESSHQSILDLNVSYYPVQNGISSDTLIEQGMASTLANICISPVTTAFQIRVFTNSNGTESIVPYVKNEETGILYRLDRDLFDVKLSMSGLDDGSDRCLWSVSAFKNATTDTYNKIVANTQKDNACWTKSESSISCDYESEYSFCYETRKFVGYSVASKNVNGNTLALCKQAWAGSFLPAVISSSSSTIFSDLVDESADASLKYDSFIGDDGAVVTLPRLVRINGESLTENYYTPIGAENYVLGYIKYMLLQTDSTGTTTDKNGNTYNVPYGNRYHNAIKTYSSNGNTNYNLFYHYTRDEVTTYTLGSDKVLITVTVEDLPASSDGSAVSKWALADYCYNDAGDYVEYAVTRTKVTIKVETSRTYTTEKYVRDCVGHDFTYCGGHVDVKSRGVVYSVRNEQEAVGGALDTNKYYPVALTKIMNGSLVTYSLEEAGYEDIRGKVSDEQDKTTIVSAYNTGTCLPVNKDIQGSNIASEQGWNLNVDLEESNWDTDFDEAGGATDAFKYRDIFDADIKTQIGNNCLPIKDWEEYTGWTADNMELVLGRITADWNSIYGFDIPSEYNGSVMLSEDNIDILVDALKEKYGSEFTETREEGIRLALSWVGNGHYSDELAHTSHDFLVTTHLSHTWGADTDNPIDLSSCCTAGSDYSFVNYLYTMLGKDMTGMTAEVYNSASGSNFVNTATSYRNAFSNALPFDLMVHKSSTANYRSAINSNSLSTLKYTYLNTQERVFIYVGSFNDSITLTNEADTGVDGITSQNYTFVIPAYVPVYIALEADDAGLGYGSVKLLWGSDTYDWVENYNSRNKIYRFE